MTSLTVRNISFDRKKNPGLEFDIIPLEKILDQNKHNHDPLNSHRVNFYVVLFITSGNGKHTIDFLEYEYGKGSILTVRKDQIHKFHPCTSEGFILLFTEEFVLSYLEKPSARKISELFNELLFKQITKLTVKELDELLLLIDQMNNEFNGPIDEHTSSIVRNYLQVFVSKVHRIRSTSLHFKKDHKYMEQFLMFQRLVESLCTKSRSVQFYADRMNVTTKTLSNMTHSMVKKSPKAFINEILTLQIKRALINTTRSIKEIAYQSGFEEPSNLFKFFKRYAGQTPKAFRQSFISGH